MAAYTVYDVLQFPNLAHLDPLLFPQVIEKCDTGLKIRSKSIVHSVADGNVLVSDGEKSVPYQVRKPGYVGLWLVFDWSNDLVMDSLDGECKINKMSTLAFIKVIYPSLSDYSIEWLMDMSAPIDKYIKTESMFIISDRTSETIAKRISSSSESKIITYDEMLSTPEKFPIPQKISAVLRRENLVGGTIYDRKDGARKVEEISSNGNVHNSPIVRYAGMEIQEGLLQKVKLF